MKLSLRILILVVGMACTYAMAAVPNSSLWNGPMPGCSPGNCVK